jgi:hypothetical protein
MTFDNPDDPDDGIFGHLDDPTPPTYGGEALTHVMQRGQQIRRRRRTVYAASVTVVVVAIAGAAIGVAATGHNGGGKAQQVNSLSRTPAVVATSPHPKKHPHKSKQATVTPGTNSATIGGTTHHHHHHHVPGGSPGSGTPVCVTSTPTPVDTPPAAPPATGSDTPVPTTSSPPPAPVVTCTTPTPTPSATPTIGAGGSSAPAAP